jgi:hypothetical protein
MGVNMGKEKKEASILGTLREVRDTGMQAWAEAAKVIATSNPFMRLQNLLSQPGLLAAGMMRKTTEAGMAQFLGRLNLPSRADVLSLSTRMTHIEATLDDLGAALEALRPAAARPVVREARPRAAVAK